MQGKKYEKLFLMMVDTRRTSAQCQCESRSAKVQKTNSMMLCVLTGVVTAAAKLNATAFLSFFCTGFFFSSAASLVF